MRRTAGVVIATIAVVLWLGAAPAVAGGWAVTTLDPLPHQPTAGQALAVTFTIRQHGMSPVNLDGVAIIVSAPGGAPKRFDARQQGDTGHYVADVTFPTAGSYTWRVDQGWFADQELGSIEVVAAPAGGATTAGATAGDGPAPPATTLVHETRWPTGARLGVTIGAVLALIALGAQVEAWRVRRAVTLERS